MKRSEWDALSPREKDALVAEALGWRAFFEKRGEYRLAVSVEPGGRDPWTTSRPQQPERYAVAGCLEAVRKGFYGRGFPEFTTSWDAMREVWTTISERPFSVRFRFMDALKADADRKAGFGVAWPDVAWMAFNPKAVALAALTALGHLEEG